MKVHVEWLDGEERTYDNVESALLDKNAVSLTLYGYSVGGYAPHIASIPLVGTVREWRKERD